MIYVTRKATFSAAHRLYNPTFSDERNEAVFDKCNNPLGHGHNYVIEVTVKGLPDPLTGYVIDLKRLKDVLDEVIIDKVDHRHLNYDVDFLRGIIPTVEFLKKINRDLENQVEIACLHDRIVNAFDAMTNEERKKLGAKRIFFDIQIMQI